MLYHKVGSLPARCNVEIPNKLGLKINLDLFRAKGCLKRQCFGKSLKLSITR